MKPALDKTDHPTPLKESLLLKACRLEETPRAPIWLMRQAGRYMKEYREIRAKMSFLDLCKNSDVAAEVTVDAAHRLGVDAAIIFSDILVVLEAMGLDLSYEKNDGPVIGNPIENGSSVASLKPVDSKTSLSYVHDAIRKTRASLKPDLPLLGFAGAPFTLASYAIEGKSSKQFIKTKTLMRAQPEVWAALMDKISDVVSDHLNAQIAAGCQAVQIFDSWAGVLSPSDYKEFVYPYTKKVIQQVKPGIPVISFGTNTGGFLELLKEAGPAVVGLDWRVNLAEAWKRLGRVAVMGNLDPVLLLTEPEVIRREAHRILTEADGRPGFIFNLGHGILPQTPVENVFTLIEAVKTASQKS